MNNDLKIFSGPVYLNNYGRIYLIPLRGIWTIVQRCHWNAQMVVVKKSCEKRYAESGQSTRYFIEIFIF